MQCFRFLVWFNDINVSINYNRSLKHKINFNSTTGFTWILQLPLQHCLFCKRMSDVLDTQANQGSCVNVESKDKL